jgi:DNA-binding winged helix-turn-helix (wHTH) protein/TolB-like protein/Tfp pilus assembly protein PilF
MVMSKGVKLIYEFGPYVLDTAERRLRRAGDLVPLEPKTFDTLVALVERSGQLVAKEELLRQIWPDTYVEEINLARNISLLRKVLAQGFADQPCIETVPKHGYRFVATVHIGAPPPDFIIEQTTRTNLHYTEEIITQTDAALTAPQRGWHVQVKAAWLTVTMLVLGLASAGFTWWQARRTPVPHTIQSIAILPFKPLDASSQEPYLEIGLTDTLITRLSHLNAVIVRPTSAIRKYAEQETEPLAAGRELAVDAVLEGSLQQLGDRLRVTVRLLRVADGKALWAHQCDTYCTDIFQTQDTVSRQVAEALRPSLSPGEQQALSKRGTNDPEAYQLYLKGLYFFNKRNSEGYRKALEYYQQAIAHDPNYALAYNGLALAQYWLPAIGVPKTEALAKSKVSLKQALVLDPVLPEAHATLGLRAMNEDWDWTTAEREFRLAIQGHPNFATAHHWYGEFLCLMGRHEEGLRELRRAWEIDPLSLIINSDLAKCLYAARQYEQAVIQAQHTLELDTNFIEPHYWLFFSLFAQGRWVEAAAIAEKVRLWDDRMVAQAQSGMAQAAQGNRQAAHRVLTVLQQTARQRPIGSALFAWIYLVLDDQEHALDWLEKAYAEHATDMIALRAPLWDNLRPNPRFQELVQRMHFPE